MSWPQELDVALEAEAAIRSFIRLRLRRTVLLPQPEGPMKPTILPFSIGTWLSRTARKSP